MTSPNGEIQRRLREYAIPTWGYRLGKDGEVEKDLFDGALPDGWTDSPANVGELAYADMVRDESAAVRAREDDGTYRGDDPATPDVNEAWVGGEAPYAMPAPPYDLHKANVLRDEIKRRTGKGTRPGTTKEQMVATLNALDAE